MRFVLSLIEGGKVEDEYQILSKLWHKPIESRVFIEATRPMAVAQAVRAQVSIEHTIHASEGGYPIRLVSGGGA